MIPAPWGRYEDFVGSGTSTFGLIVNLQSERRSHRADGAGPWASRLGVEVAACEAAPALPGTYSIYLLSCFILGCISHDNFMGLLKKLPACMSVWLGIPSAGPIWARLGLGASIHEGQKEGLGRRLSCWGLTQDLPDCQCPYVHPRPFSCGCSPPKNSNLALNVHNKCCVNE